MTVEGLDSLEALAQLGFTAEQFSNFSLVSSLMNQAVGYGVVFQTVSGISSLVSAGIRLGIGERSIVNPASLEKPLVNIRGPFLQDRGHPNLSLEFSLDPLNVDQSFLNILGHQLWKSIKEHKKLGLYSNLAKLLENSRWDVRSLKSKEESGNVINLMGAPGGAHQSSSPDWMLPLILGLNGSLTYHWQYLHDGS
ncbi:VP3 [Pumfec polyomavirus LSF128]|nr:VP3 [Pumfec polyomavirus LSF128]